MNACLAPYAKMECVTVETKLKMTQLCNHGKSNSAGYKIVFSLFSHICNMNNFLSPFTFAFC